MLLYYLPGESLDRLWPAGIVSQETLAEFGLGATLADCQQSPRDLAGANVQRGPDGGAGAVCWPALPGREPPPLGKGFPDSYTWLACTPASARPFWLGWPAESPPQPEDLARRRQIGGYSVPDAAGRNWQIPVVRSPHDALGQLPKEFAFDGAGRLARRLKPQYLALWESLGRIWDAVHGAAGDGQESDEWLVERAVELLGLNYRLDRFTLAALAGAGCGVLDDETLRAILLVAVDWPAVEALKKKPTI